MMTPNCPKPTERHAAIATPKYPVSRVSTFSPKLKIRKKTTASSVQSKVRKLDKENVNPIDVLDQLETTNALLKTVVKRLEDQDKKIQHCRTKCARQAQVIQVHVHLEQKARKKFHWKSE